MPTTARPYIRCPVQCAWNREFRLPWREAGPPYHHDNKVDSDQKVVNKELSLCVVAPLLLNVSTIQGVIGVLPFFFISLKPRVECYKCL